MCGRDAGDDAHVARGGRVAPVGAQEAPSEDIADRLVQSVASYTVTPEGTGSGNSRAVTLEDLAAIAGVDLPDHAGGTGYLRLFAKPTGDGVAAVMGFDLGAGDASDFVAGFRESGDEQATSMPLFPTPRHRAATWSPTKSRIRRAHSTRCSRPLPATRWWWCCSQQTPTTARAVLRQMAQDQAALTPPTSAPAEKPENMAYALGRIAGFVLILCVPAWLIIRAVRHREPPGLAVPGQTAAAGQLPVPRTRSRHPLPRWNRAQRLHRHRHCRHAGQASRFPHWSPAQRLTSRPGAR
jgi:hypothetical protein